jgi:hypothetical protein
MVARCPRVAVCDRRASRALHERHAPRLTLCPQSRAERNRVEGSTALSPDLRASFQAIDLDDQASC